MDRENLKKDIVEFLKKNGSYSIKEITRMYDDCQYIPRKVTRAVIKELINDGIVVRVEDVDIYGNKVDDITLNDDET